MKETVEFYDIYDYYYTPFWEKTWFEVTVIVAITALITLALVWWFVWRKKKPLTPGQWAKKELAGLAVHKCVTQQDFRVFYFKLTAIIKGYLTRRYAWTIDDKTDQELVAWLEEQEFDSNTLELLRQLAEGAMWVKFANTSALKSQAETDLKTVYTMIERTTLQENK